MKHKIDVSFYAIIDEDYVGRRDIGDCARELVQARVSVIQYRTKSLPSREFLLRAISIASAIRGTGVPLIINDRLDIALLTGARGVHLGDEDIPIEKAREVLGPNRIIGASVSTVEEAIHAERSGADYLGAGAVFRTSTKSDVPVIGIEGLKEISFNVKIPVVAIGGLKLENVAQVIEAGASGLAFISELMKCGDIRKKAQELRVAIEAARNA